MSEYKLALYTYHESFSGITHTLTIILHEREKLDPV